MSPTVYGLALPNHSSTSNTASAFDIIPSIDKDGTREGYDLELTKKVSETVGIPVIASGGAGNMDQMLAAIVEGRADAVLLASLLHFGELTIAEIKKYLHKKGVCVRW